MQCQYIIYKTNTIQCIAFGRIQHSFIEIVEIFNVFALKLCFLHACLTL